MLMNEQESIDLSPFMIKIQEGYSFGPFFDYIGETGISVFCRKFQTLSSIDIIHVQLSIYMMSVSGRDCSGRSFGEIGNEND